MPENTAQSNIFKLILTGAGVKMERQVSEEQARVILNLVMGGSTQPATPSAAKVGAGGPGQPGLGTGQTAKQFMAAKQPRSDMERVACLGFYLTHMKATPAFNTKDIETLNREASQGPFPETKVAVNNATRNGYMAPAGGGKKQITARGEELVNALPDREAVKQALTAHPLRKRRKRKSKQK